MDILLFAIFLAPPAGILIGLAVFPWRHTDVRRGWPLLLLLLLPSIADLAVGIAFIAPAGFRQMPAGVGAFLWICLATSVVIGIYLVALPLRRMWLSASMFSLGGIGITFAAQFFAGMSVTANWL